MDKINFVVVNSLQFHLQVFDHPQKLELASWADTEW